MLRYNLHRPNNILSIEIIKLGKNKLNSIVADGDLIRVAGLARGTSITMLVIIVVVGLVSRRVRPGARRPCSAAF